MTIVRRIVLYLFYAACFAVVLIAALYVAAIVAMFLSPFDGLEGSTEFIDKNG